MADPKQQHTSTHNTLTYHMGQTRHITQSNNISHNLEVHNINQINHTYAYPCNITCSCINSSVSHQRNILMRLLIVCSPQLRWMHIVRQLYTTRVQYCVIDRGTYTHVYMCACQHACHPAHNLLHTLHLTHTQWSTICVICSHYVHT